ncbi:SH2 domain-containing protein [Caenorhabditis elegans]|uniref:SH2 domain-containing protein n=1 Tax=Caenorhabditis elegans TaxID=6239 RepID=Q9XWW5_CAEEL|nr:SH2 domain-containing protein [Caenorhabditis elegans]CAA21524.1 SH2 domain-containing protein [Caenorhabditis elegans]|eukprot:NP_499670.1 Uncharacterized protein CELE_Y37D8A.4 [Caenorhabditis elegans]
MTLLLPRRRFSALLDHIKNWTSSIRADKQYRSFSTGDLVSPSQPSAFEPDFMEMEFGATPTTSSLPSHFDDNDLVPVEFKKSGVKLIPQGTRKAEKAKKFGSFEELSKVKLEDIHRAQSWFFVDVDPKSAERILMSNGFSDSSFLISFFRQKYVLSIWRKTKVEHLVIRNYQKKNGTMAFQLDIDRSFKNLVELTEYYTKNKSYVLCTKLSKGVSRPRRNPDTRTRA